MTKPKTLFEIFRPKEAAMRTKIVIEREATGEWPTLVQSNGGTQYCLIGTHPAGLALYMHQGYSKHTSSKDWLVRWADGHTTSHVDYPSLRVLRERGYSDAPQGNWKGVKETA